MAAPALVVAGVELAGAASTEAKFTAPTREANNGLVVMLWTESTAVTPTTPTGWELWCTEAKTNFKVRWYKRIADNTATDNFASTFASTFRFGAMRRITGNSTELSKWIVGTVNTGTVAAVTHTGVTTVSSENLLLGLYNTSVETTPSSVTAGWTKSFIGTIAPLYWKERAATGAESNLVVTNSGASNWVAFMGAIPPPEAAATTLNSFRSLLGVGI